MTAPLVSDTTGKVLKRIPQGPMSGDNMRAKLASIPGTLWERVSESH